MKDLNVNQYIQQFLGQKVKWYTTLSEYNKISKQFLYSYNSSLHIAPEKGRQEATLYMQTQWEIEILITW